MARDLEYMGWVEAYFRERPDLSHCSFEIRSTENFDEAAWVFLDSLDERCPQLVVFHNGLGCGSPQKVVPYFCIEERPNRQIVSYFLGRELCNLAEVREHSGRLYSRYCGSYDLDDLPQKRASLSRIALWMHDCLTEDFDHQTSLNRQSLEEGVCISYDFGMAFSNHYFPPFYAMELGISDESILENRFFLLELLASYARWVRTDEEEVVERLERSYPGTCHGDRCRYYLRNYKAHFASRLYFGRFFEKIRTTPFEAMRLKGVAEALGMDMREVADWASLIGLLRERGRGGLDLRGLDLSDMDLRRADLRGADLTGASLAGADLREAILSGVDRRDANLEGAKTDG
jgi:hypothetical protein